MNTRNGELSFSINDRVDNFEVGVSHVPLGMLGTFQKDVSEFLRGSAREVEPNDLIVSIVDGSVRLNVAAGLLVATTLFADIDRLQTDGNLNFIDPKRATVIERWQTAAKQNAHRKYRVFGTATNSSITVDSNSDYRRIETTWIPIEKYLSGKVLDLGGKTKANIHIELSGGTSVTVAAPQELLEREEKNRLYKNAVLYVSADQNIDTGELKNYKLLSFSDVSPVFDQGEFDTMVEKGVKAWSDVPNATEWLENLRGGNA
jgi:hypothetical protein